MMTFISIGGNIGDPIASIKRASEVLAENGLRKMTLSPMYLTSPVDCVPGTPDFINAVIAGEWDDCPQELLALCQRLEAASGRPVDRCKNAPRTLDLDIILFGDKILEIVDLTIPHPRASERLFVLCPLCDIAPDAFFPDLGRTASELLAELRDKDSDQEIKIIKT